MALKKSELYSSLWRSCDELRGGMDASQYKDYVLTLLFVKYLSDKHACKRGAPIHAGRGRCFADLVGLKGDKAVGEKINAVIGDLARANGLAGIIDQVNFNDEAKLGAGKEMQDRLTRLIAIFESLDFSENRAEGDDLLGDAYEYLMRHFASESGRSKGQFYTPAEVSRVMVKVLGIGRDTTRHCTIYDPACGTGSLLIKAADEAQGSIALHGQDMDGATLALAKMNMILHGQTGAELARGNTLAAPQFRGNDGKLKTFDYAVANPPFSVKAWSNGLHPESDAFDRFEYGVPPARNGDYAFLLHLIKSLKSDGRGAIILPHGVLFRGGREADIRRNLVDRGLIEAVIGLPANLFFGTSIPACIVVVDKRSAGARDGIFMIDASAGFIKDGHKNRLRAQDIHKIVDVYTRRIELPGYSRMVSIAEIAARANDYSLNIPRYIDASEQEDLHDLDAHLNGGIPDAQIDALAEYWAVFPSLRTALFKPGARPGYSEARMNPKQIAPAIEAHPELTAYLRRVRAVFEAWRRAHRPMLARLKVNDVPRLVIHRLSEDLLARFEGFPLMNKYDVYQRIMDYWAETMQDDMHLIVAVGWTEAARPRAVIDDRNKNIREMPDLTIGRDRYKTDVILPALVVARCLPEEGREIEELQQRHDVIAHEIQEISDQCADDGLLQGVIDEKGKVSMAAIKEHLGKIAQSMDLADEREMLERLFGLIKSQAEGVKAIKAAQATLNLKVLKQYARLGECEIKSLIIDDKWFASIEDAIEGEVDRLMQRFAGRVQELEAIYAQPLPELEWEVKMLAKKVESHLKRMGVACSRT